MLVAAFLTLATFAFAGDGTVRGEVRDRATGAPVADAAVTLDSALGETIAVTRTDRRGRFIFERPFADREIVVVTAREFRAVAVTVTEPSGTEREASLTIALDRLPPMPEIGRVASRSSQTSDATATQRVGTQTIERDAALRITDALGKLAGVTVSGDAAAPGGDAYVNLRGLRPGESRTLLDGHQIGPLGVAAQSPDADGTIAGFNYQDALYFALRDVDVALGITGGADAGDSLGGTIDLLTLEPSKRDERVFELGYGNQGRALASIRASGTSGKFGYAIVHGVVGTYGAFGGSSIAQTGLRGTDLTRATLNTLTYHVSGDYTLRNELAKLTYTASPATRLSFTAYDATSWADKTGEGDNDDNPEPYVLANAPVGASPACPHGVLATTDVGMQCVSPQAYAAAASGPAGGGPGAWQALRNQDYAATATSVAGPSTYMLELFTDRYAVLYHRDASDASGPLDTFLDRWTTSGMRLADDLRTGKNDVRFGITALEQTLDGNGTSPDGGSLIATPATRRDDASAFVRDTYALTPRLSLIANAWFVQTNALPHAHVDPQAALVYRPSTRDTLRIGAGRAVDEPALQSPRVDLLPAGALNPDCGAIARASSAAPANVNVGSAPASNLTAERGTDLEFGYARRFGSDGTLGLTLYDANVTDRIVTGDFRAGSQLPASAEPGFVDRIDQFCGSIPAPGAVDFTLSRAFNAATARLRGLEFAGHVPVAPRVAFDYGYDVQTVVVNDLPANVLETDPTLVNGVQTFGVPSHKASLGIAARSGAYEFRLDGHAVGPNNPQQLPGYAYADASLTRSAGRVGFLFAASNVFGGHAQTYGYVGEGVPYATNAFNQRLANPDVQPFNERYGLAPTTFTLSATAHI